MAGIPDLVKLVADLATYEARVAEGKTSPNTIYLVLAERKVFFQGEDWTAGNGVTIAPELIEGFIPLRRDFSDDFNNDFAR